MLLITQNLCAMVKTAVVARLGYTHEVPNIRARALGRHHHLPLPVPPSHRTDVFQQQ